MKDTKVVHIVRFAGGESSPDGVLMKAGTREAYVIRCPDGTLAETVIIQEGQSEAEARLKRLAAQAELILTKGRTAPVVAEAVRAVVPVAAAFLTPLPWLTLRFAALEGLARLAIFSALLYLMSRTPEARKLFRYHGAEHKVISCLRQGLELTPDNARRQTTYARGCSASAQAIQWILCAIAVPLVRTDNFLLGTAIRLALLYAARRAGIWLMVWEHKREKPVRWLLAPGKLMQRFTALEPGNGEIEVAIRAAELALGIQKRGRNARRKTKIRIITGNVRGDTGVMTV